MSCGHSFCDGCLKKGSAVGKKCEICQKRNEIDSAKLGESPIAKMFIKMHISEICIAAEKEFEKAFKTVKGKIRSEFNARTASYKYYSCIEFKDVFFLFIHEILVGDLKFWKFLMGLKNQILNCKLNSLQIKLKSFLIFDQL